MILKVDKLCKKIGKKTILKDVSFEINEGDILAFIGPNGAGKTTTIKCILGLQYRFCWRQPCELLEWGPPFGISDIGSRNIWRRGKSRKSVSPEYVIEGSLEAKDFPSRGIPNVKEV